MSRSYPVSVALADRIDATKRSWLPIAGHVVNVTFSLVEADMITAALRASQPATPTGGEARDNTHCSNGLEHGNCLYPDCISSCPGRLRSSAGIGDADLAKRYTDACFDRSSDGASWLAVNHNMVSLIQHLRTAAQSEREPK